MSLYCINSTTSSLLGSHNFFAPPLRRQRDAKSDRIAILSGIEHPEYRMVMPIDVHIERDEYGDYVVTPFDRPPWPVTVYGAGSTEAEATQDFVSMLIDIYEELDASANVLAPHLIAELEFLRTIIVPIVAADSYGNQ